MLGTLAYYSENMIYGYDYVYICDWYILIYNISYKDNELCYYLAYIEREIQRQCIINRLDVIISTIVSFIYSKIIWFSLLITHILLYCKIQK